LTSDYATRIGSDLLAVLRSVAGDAAGQPIPLHEPSFSELEQRMVRDCIASTYVSSIGRYVDDFGTMLERYTGACFAIPVVNGTSALQVALTVAGVKAGDEVLVPALSFVATANAVTYCGATPHFLDSDSAIPGISVERLSSYLRTIGRPAKSGLVNRTTDRPISAIVPMHAFGHPVDMKPLLTLCATYGIAVVEDAAESLGSFYSDRHTGTLGLLGTLSFNGNKIVTTGGGGAVLTNEEHLARRVKHLTTTAKVPHPWRFVHDAIGWNFRMPNLNAALGCAQLQRLPEFLAKKRSLAEAYRRAFSDVRGLSFVDEPAGSRSNFWLCTIRVWPRDANLRDGILEIVNQAGYGCRPAWTLLPKLPMYSACPRAPLDEAEMWEANSINLPSSPGLMRSP